MGRARTLNRLLALSATTGNILTLIMSQAVRQALIGTLIGWILSLGLARLIAANVQAAPVFDLVSVVLAASCVFVACAFAAFLASRRASAVDPTTAPRYD